MVRESTGELIPVYGRELFYGVPSTFAPGPTAQVTGDYVIGPGDEILLRLWGAESRNEQLTVDRGGNIYVPQFGSVRVAGLRFSELQQFLESTLRKSFRNFSLSVDLGHLRSISIVVLGDAVRPGTYTVSALSTLVDAVMASGGPSVHGSLRSIELRRDGKTAAIFDFYDLLQRGDRLKDLRLLPGDIIFIPTVGPQVALVGGVERPAIYEIREGETLSAAVALAGGYSAAAAGDGRVSLERVEKGKGRTTTEIAVNDVAMANQPLRNGDLLRVGVLRHEYDNTVTLRGNVAEPGRFGWKPGMRLSDILPEKPALLTPGYWEHRNELGVPILSFQRQSTPAATEAGRVSSQRSTSNSPSPLGIQTADPSERRTTVTIAAPEINWNYAVIERLNPQTLHSELLPFNLGKLVDEHDATQNLPLLPGDVVTIFSQLDVVASREQQTRYIRLEGEFVSSGVYSVQPNETLTDVIRRAGGFTRSAYLYGASFTRESTRIMQQQRLDEYLTSVALELDRASAREQMKAASSEEAGLRSSAVDAQKNQIARLQAVHATGRIVLGLEPSASLPDDLGAVELENGDVLRVPSRPMVVNVVGAVFAQTSLRYSSSWKLRDYLEAAGDLRPGADPKHSFLIRADGSVIGRTSAKRREHASFEKLPIYPGDTIVIPDKPIKISGFRTVLDYSQLFSQFALGAATVSVLASR